MVATSPTGLNRKWRGIWISRNQRCGCGWNVARADRCNGKPGVLTTAERDELTRLRKENRQLRLEREILAKHI
jgi:transposase-like protein